MSQNLPPLNALKPFVETARLGTITSAAQSLHRSHGAVSRQIKALEVWLHVDLFERNQGRLVLTESGRHYFDAVNRGLLLIERATKTFVRETREDILRIACPQVFAKRWLIPRLYQFHQSRPHLEVSLIDDFNGAVLDQSDFDIAITMAPINDPQIDVEPLMPYL